MRKLLLATFFILLFTITAQSQTATVNLAWDKNPDTDQVTKYTAYEKVGSSYNNLGDILLTACDATTCRHSLPSITPGVHTYVVSASNIWGESGYSNEASTPGPATPPRNVIITITITVTP
ncbi:MAG: hypothetical protein ABIH23_10095 [bacterium]